ncbi:hypothetical protein [Leifsonia xyli]|uniref:hypothetical protein n=1 Tax=Leifsonia xyli TaxID=1575 RepID=UPI003D672FED
MTPAERAARYLDLESAPFTLPGSRILVLRADGGLTVRLAEYERRLDDCVLVRTLRVFGADGRLASVSGVHPDRIEFADAGVTLTFDGPAALSLGGDTRWSVELELAGPGDTGGAWHPGLPSAQTARWGRPAPTTSRSGAGTCASPSPEGHCGSGSPPPPRKTTDAWITPLR